MFSSFKKFVVKKIATVPVTNEALQPKDIEYISYPVAVDREEQIALAEASAMLMSKFAF